VQIARHRDQDFHLGYDNHTVARLLVLIILIVVAVWLVRRALRRVAQKDAARDMTPDELVRCAHCGVLLPRAEARQAAGAVYCSEDHATRGPGAR
jgi:uncharacterized protein